MSGRSFWTIWSRWSTGHPAKKDTAWLGRFTFEALRDFSGLARILTILARGFLFHALGGTLLSGDPRGRISQARNGLCAWCSVPGIRPEPPRVAVPYGVSPVS